MKEYECSALGYERGNRVVFDEDFTGFEDFNLDEYDENIVHPAFECED